MHTYILPDVTSAAVHCERFHIDRQVFGQGRPNKNKSPTERRGQEPQPETDERSRIAEYRSRNLFVSCRSDDVTVEEFTSGVAGRQLVDATISRRRKR